MLQKLVIRNFQAHKKLEVDLDPHVTTIVGPSDTGKSSVIRALRWLVTNQPSGVEFIREGTSKTQVGLTVDDRLITRKRGKSENTYSLETEEFKAFGSGVPPEVVGLLNLGPLNFQQQHDSPFWFSETAGEVSRQLNRIINLDIIDSTLANLDQTLRKARMKVDDREEDLKAAKEQRSGLKWVLEADKVLKGVEEAHERWQEASRERARLDSVLREARYTRERSRCLLGGFAAASEVLQKGEAWDRSVQQVGELEDLVQEVRTFKRAASRPVPDLEDLEEKYEKTLDAARDMVQLQHWVRKLKEAAEDIQEAEEALAETKAKYEEERGEACPMCERAW